MVTKFDRAGDPPWGLRGGGPGRPGYVELVRASGGTERFYKGERQLQAGDVVHFVSGGGGGYEPALARDPAAVATDVREDYVSREAARSDYGVVLTGDLKVDAVATNELRASLGKKETDDPTTSVTQRGQQ